MCVPTRVCVCVCVFEKLESLVRRGSVDIN